MIPALKDKWVAALRSGEYDQGTERLRTDYDTFDGHPASEFCCLGVLCDVIDPGGWDDGGQFLAEINGKDVRMDVQLADEALEALGITEYEQQVLIGMNDEQHDDFDTIADWIESRL